MHNINAELLTFIYHEVTDQPSQSGFNRKSALPYKLGTDEFEVHLDIIANASDDVCLISDTKLHLNHRRILLTFDDGGKSAMHIADRIEERGWKGHFFITTKKLNTANFLTGKDVIELASRGHVIGSHSHSHPDIFFCLTKNKMKEEWKMSCDILSQLLNEKITVASIPGGDMNMLAVETAYAAGIRYLFTSEPTKQPWSYKELVCIGRVCSKKGTAAEEIKHLTEFKGFTKLMLIRKTKQYIKKFLPQYYQKRVNEGIANSN